MKPSILPLLLAGLLALSLTACGSSQPEETDPVPAQETAAPPESADLRVGLLLRGEGTDLYDGGHLAGMRAACENLGLDFDTQVILWEDADSASSCTKGVQSLLSQGCQILFADFAQQESCLTQAAALSPETEFCCALGYQGASDNLDNTHNYYAEVYQARYLAGIAAGLRTQTGKLGYVAAFPYAEVISGCSAYYLGARSVAPDVTMLVAYTNSWADPEEETAAAQALIDQGCDVLAYHTDTSVPVSVAQANGVWAVGCDEDMTQDAPDAALVSTRIDWSQYYTYALGCLLEGNEIDQDWWGDYAGGVCQLTGLNRKAAAPGTAEAVDAAANGLADGTLHVFAGPLRGVDADGRALTLARGEVYEENETASVPSFVFLVDGITVIS